MRDGFARWSGARGRAAIVLLCLASVACATATQKRYETMRGDWQRLEVATPADDDPTFLGTSVLERAALVAAVLERNPNVRAAQHAWRAALARHPQVTSLDDPMLGLGVAPLSFGSSRVDGAAVVDLSQKLPFPGKLRLRGEAALGEAEAAARDHDAVRLRIATMASLLFDDYALAARAQEINARHVALLEEFQHIATIRYEAGEGSQQDPIQAEVRLVHAQHRDVVLETARRVASEQINALLHRAPRSELPPPPTPREQARELGAELAAEALIEQALAAHPELAAAGARVEAEQARVSLARREYFPDFTVVGRYNGVMQEEDLQPYVGVQLNVPLSLARRHAALDEAQARRAQAESRRLAVEDEVRLSVQSGVDRLDEAIHVADLFRDRLVPAAQDQVEAARVGFETGRNGFLALIDAERNLLDAELGSAEAHANLGRRRAELDRAVGRIPGLDW